MTLAGLALVISVVVPERVNAQNPPKHKILLIHGFNSNGDGWASMQSQIEANIPTVQVSRPNLAKHDGVEVQANQLATILGFDTMAVAVAHSAGGVSARALDRTTNGRLRGIITVGSPLRGAAVATDASIAFALADLNHRIYKVLRPWDHYFQSNWSYWVGTGWDILAGIASFVPPIDSDTRRDIAQGSTYMNTMNARLNLDREAASGLSRLAIVNMTQPYSQACRNVEWFSTCDYLMDFLDNLYFDAWTHYATLYCSPSEPDYFECLDDRDHAYLWLDGANAFAGLDGMWCTVIGADVVPSVGCLADGLIAGNAQAFPEVPPAHVNLDGPNHHQERTDPGVRSQILGLLLQFPWPAPQLPPPPEISVSISGEQTVQPWETYTYTAVVGGASPQPPFAFEWYVNEIFSGTGATIALEFLPASATGILVRVVDAAAKTAESDGMFFVYASTGTCPPLDPECNESLTTGQGQRLRAGGRYFPPALPRAPRGATVGKRVGSETPIMKRRP